MLKPRDPDWYRRAWSLDAQTQSWTEETEKQVDFVIGALGLTGRERILDLACGYGRHALSLARRGYEVIGVDLTPAYVAFAANAARAEGLSARFECMDIRDVPYADAFDAVLSMADGAVGYLETDAENQKIFDVIARALKPGGRHFLDVCNAEHAEKHFPKKWWECGTHALALAQFDWDAKTRRMLYAGWDVPFGQPAERPVVGQADPIRLYTPAELSSLYAARGMRMLAAYSDYEGRPASDAQLQLLTTAEKTR